MPRYDPKDAGSVVAYADKVEEFWRWRNLRMLDHQDLYEFVPTVKEAEGHLRRTENTAWSVASYAAAVIATNEPQHRIPYVYGPGDTADQEARSGALERFLIGVWNMVNDDQVERRRAPLHVELAHYACLRGWIAGQAVWTGEPPLPYQIRLWDPFHIYPDPDIPSLVVRRYRRSLASVLDEYPKLTPKFKDKPSQQDCDAIEVWDGETHAVVIQGQFAKKPTPHGLAKPPIIVLPVGGYPIRSIASRLQGSRHSSQLGENAYVAHVGQGVLYGITEDCKYENLLSSQVADLFEFYHSGIVITRTEDGRPIDVSLDPGDSVALRVGETLDVLRPQNWPSDLAGWMQRLQMLIQRGSFPAAMYGASPQDLSGFARSLVHNAGLIRVGPALLACTQFYEKANALILEQLEKMGAPMQVTLRGTDYAGKVFKEITDIYDLKELVGEDYQTQVKIEPFLPQDLPQAVAMAGQLKQQRIWTNKTINDVLFAKQVQDAQGEEQRLGDELLKNNPEAVGMMARVTAPVVVSREMRRQLDRQNITQQEYDMVMAALQNELRIGRGIQEKTLQQVTGGPPPPGAMSPGVFPGPGGAPQDLGAFPPGQQPQQPQLPPEILAAQMQGSPSPPGVGPPGGPGGLPF